MGMAAMELGQLNRSLTERGHKVETPPSIIIYSLYIFRLMEVTFMGIPLVINLKPHFELSTIDSHGGHSHRPASFIF